MINAISFNSLRNTEFNQFMSDVLALVLLNGPAALKVEKAFNALKANSTELGELFKADRSNPLTEEVIALDQRRDEAITGIGLYIEAYTHHYDPALRKAATLLFDNLSSYGAGIARQNYPAETTTLNNIFNDWEKKPALAEAIALLGLGAWKAEMAAANTAFSSKYVARANDSATTESDSTMKAKRMEAIKAWYRLRDLLVSNYHIKEEEGSGTEPYKLTINGLNAIADKYNQLLAARKGKDNGDN